MTATAIDSLLAPLLVWRDILLVYTALLWLEAPALLWLALWWGRPRWEWLVALAPAAGFAAAHYGPEYLPNFDAQNTSDIQAAVAGAQTLGWTACAVTAALLTFGWVLVARWQARSGSVPEAAPAVAADTKGELSTVPAAAAPDEAPDGDVEIMVEPMDAS